MKPQPYYKYGYWYVPKCDIRFESDDEAWAYIESHDL